MCLGETQKHSRGLPYNLAKDILEYPCKNHPNVICLCWLFDFCLSHRRFCPPAGHMTLVIGPRSRSWPTCWRNCPNSTAVCLILATSGSLQSTYPRIWHTVKRGRTGCRNLHSLQKRWQRWPQRPHNASRVLLFGYFLSGLLFLSCFYQQHLSNIQKSSVSICNSTVELLNRKKNPIIMI